MMKMATGDGFPLRQGARTGSREVFGGYIGLRGWWVLELKLGAPIYRQIDGMAVNGESVASDDGGAVGWQGV